MKCMARAFVLALSFVVVACGGSGSSDGGSVDATTDTSSDGTAFDVVDTMPKDSAVFHGLPADARCTDGEPVDALVDLPEKACPFDVPPAAAGCDHPSGEECWYWPTPTRDACQRCTCESGVWACSASACPFPFDACDNDRCCDGVGLGCGTGHCGASCICGVDHAFHCMVQPC